MLTTQTEEEVLLPRAQSSPALIFETLNKFQHTMALKGAIDLELFTCIAEGAETPAEIAVRCKATERGVRILCNFLAINGFLVKNGDGFALTQDSDLFLNKHSPAYMGTIANFIASETSLACFGDVAALVRNGGPVDDADVNEPEHETWVDFARWMMPLAAMSSRLLATHVSEPGRKIKVLDIAAGHGLFGIAVAQLNPAAEIVAVDWRNVLDFAKQNAERAGVGDRFSTIPGSAFEVDLGSGYDVVLIPNFLHHFGVATNISLLEKIRKAMNPNGFVATLEFVPNDDRVSPLIAASFSMIMLSRTKQGDAYTFREIDDMFRQAGFRKSRMRSLEPIPQHLILTSL